MLSVRSNRLRRVSNGGTTRSGERASELLGTALVPRISLRGEVPPLAAGHFLLFATSFNGVGVREFKSGGGGTLLGNQRVTYADATRACQFHAVLMMDSK